MLNFLRFARREQNQSFVIIARYKEGDWFRRFLITETSGYRACRVFDQSPEFEEWTRVSNASLEN